MKSRSAAHVGPTKQNSKKQPRATQDFIVFRVRNCGLSSPGSCHARFAKRLREDSIALLRGEFRIVTRLTPDHATDFATDITTVSTRKERTQEFGVVDCSRFTWQSKDDALSHLFHILNSNVSGIG